MSTLTSMYFGLHKIFFIFTVSLEKIKNAEAQAETLYLSGVGTAQERTAIYEGIKSNLTDKTSSPSCIHSKDIMDILLLSQYYDTLSNIGGESIMLTHDPIQTKELRTQLDPFFNKAPIERIPGFESFPL